jgi:hypothetical protein
VDPSDDFTLSNRMTFQLVESRVPSKQNNQHLIQHSWPLLTPEIQAAHLRRKLCDEALKILELWPKIDVGRVHQNRQDSLGCTRVRNNLLNIKKE